MYVDAVTAVELLGVDNALSSRSRASRSAIWDTTGSWRTFAISLALSPTLSSRVDVEHKPSRSADRCRLRYDEKLGAVAMDWPRNISEDVLGRHPDVPMAELGLRDRVPVTSEMVVIEELVPAPRYELIREERDTADVLYGVVVNAVVEDDGSVEKSLVDVIAAVEEPELELRMFLLGDNRKESPIPELVLDV